jgi:hypothetical protein
MISLAIGLEAALVMSRKRGGTLSSFSLQLSIFQWLARFQSTNPKCFRVRIWVIFGCGSKVYHPCSVHYADHTGQSFIPTSLVIPLALLWNSVDWYIRWYHVGAILLHLHTAL